MFKLVDWQSVPETVVTLLPRALEIQIAYTKIASETGDLAGSRATWLIEEDVLVCYRPNAARRVKLGHLNNGSCFRIRDLAASPDIEKEILIKEARIPVVGHVFDFGHKMLGGPTPLANGIVSGLMLGGLGYGAGALAENLFPERYLQRGRLRKTLGLLGLGAGAGLAAHNAYVNSRVTGKNFLRGLVTPNNTDIAPYRKELIKESFQQFPSQMRQPGLFEPVVNVPQFNQAAWGDVQRGIQTNNFQNYTPPQYAAATTGLMSGISTAQRSPIIRPVDVIRGIASAGIGLATANVAGRALSALAGLSPAGQEKLQDMGLWGGMMHAIVPSMFGSR